MLWGPLADLKGRRPTYIVCLGLLTLSSIACALVPTNKWWLLLIFRCFQASGGASTVALGAGVVADLARPQERGGFYGVLTVGALVGPCIGPVFGGIIGDALGWRWIFWFLAICAGGCLLLIVLVFPETLRRIVGNGTIQAPSWDRPVLPLFPLVRQRRKADQNGAHQPLVKTKVNPFLLFKEPDVIFILVANGLVYGLTVGIQASSSLLFQTAYPSLTLSEIGLCKFLDRQYKRDRRQWETRKKQEREEAGERVDAPWSEDDELTFPIERARLKLGAFYTFCVCAVSIGYGWVLDRHGPLAVALILQFIAGYVIIGQMNAFQTLLIDLFPKAGSSATAINNCVRCLIGAVVASVIDLILKALGTGWTYVLLSGLCLLITPAFTVIMEGTSLEANEINFVKLPRNFSITQLSNASSKPTSEICDSEENNPYELAT
ncbi:hypothetical protein FRC00_002113 [Tulasnella sp. 408]|nr:hypothetical protein FRC00_002113 [Tulasnella sp. 408]